MIATNGRRALACLADIIALSSQAQAGPVTFVHDEAARATLTADDIPARFRDLIIE